MARVSELFGQTLNSKKCVLSTKYFLSSREIWMRDEKTSLFWQKKGKLKIFCP